MTVMIKTIGRIADNLLPWAALAIIGIINYGYLFHMPSLGFGLNNPNLVIRVAESDGTNPFQVGDELLQFGDTTLEMIETDQTQSFYHGIQPGDTVPVTLLRQGQPLSFNYTIPPSSAEEFLARIQTQWFVGYIFWLAGLAAMLFLRPRNAQRLLLGLFCFLTGIWFVLSNLSSFQYWNGALYLRAAFWLSVPVYWQLHWHFPRSLGRLPKWFWGALYATAGAMALVSWLQLVPAGFMYLAFLLMLGGSLLLLAVHLVRQPDERRGLLAMAAALGIALIPAFVVGVLGALGVTLSFTGVAVLGLAALPGFYFFTLYQRQLTPPQATRARRLVRVYALMIFAFALIAALTAFFIFNQTILDTFDGLSMAAIFALLLVAVVSFMPFLILPALADAHITLAGDNTLGFSANRAATALSFLLGLMLIEVLFVALLQGWLAFPGAEAIISTLAAFSAAALTLVFYGPFQRFFEQRVLGMKLTPETLMAAYADRITTSLERRALERLLLQEVMPSLLVRQFALLQFAEDGLRPLFTLRVSAEMLPAADAPVELAKAAEKLDVHGAGLPAWVRLALPMKMAGKTVGYWLLGQRDPDDRYPDQDVEQLQTLAQQTALALANIEQAENLRALYIADIDHREAERTHLAAELHDNVLNELAILGNHLDSAAPAAQAAHRNTIAQVREIVNGLRPPMLQYGLAAGLETLADELAERLPDGPKVLTDLPEALWRYNERVELYLFRIVQQACSNAVQHAGCTRIQIRGRFSAGAVELQVSDDGTGFPASGTPDLQQLLANKHFGLAGMYERSAIIGARMRVESQPGQGSTVKIDWREA